MTTGVVALCGREATQGRRRRRRMRKNRSLYFLAVCFILPITSMPFALSIITSGGDSGAVDQLSALDSTHPVENSNTLPDDAKWHPKGTVDEEIENERPGEVGEVPSDDSNTPKKFLLESVYKDWMPEFKKSLQTPHLYGPFKQAEKIAVDGTAREDEDTADEKVEDQYQSRILGRGFRKDKYGAVYIDTNMYEDDPDHPNAEDRQALVSCHAKVEPCKPELRIPGIYPTMRWTRPRITRARWVRICHVPFPCATTEGQCTEYAENGKCQEGSKDRGEILLDDPELLIIDMQPHWVEIRSGEVVNWRMAFKDITRNGIMVPKTIQEATAKIGKKTLMNSGLEIKMLEVHKWRSKYEFCSLQSEFRGDLLVRRFFEWLYMEEECANPFPCKSERAPLGLEETGYKSTVWDRCKRYMAGTTSICPVGTTRGRPDKFCDRGLPDILHMTERGFLAPPPKGDGGDESSTTPSPEHGGPPGVAELSEIALSLQRFRIHDSREEPGSGKLQYRILRLGVDSWVNHEHMCDNAPEAVWLFYRHAGAFVCDLGARPCLDRTNMACVAETSIMDNGGFLGADTNPTGPMTSSICPVGTVKGYDQVCGKDYLPPHIPPHSGVAPDRVTPMGVRNDVGKIRLRRRMQAMLQPRSDVAQYDPYPSSNPDCPQLRSVIVQVEGSGDPDQTINADAEAAARHVARFTGLWDIHRDNGLTMGQLFAASRLPIAVTQRTFLAGLDGRADFAVAGAPGGEVGEFIVAVVGLERARAELLKARGITRASSGNDAHVNLSREEIRELVLKYVRWLISGGYHQFYLGTDLLTARKWAAAAGAPAALLTNPDIFLRGLSSSAAAQRLFDRDVRERMTRLSAQPQYIGDTHLRSMLLSPGEYMVRKELVEEVLRTFAGIYLGTMKVPDTASPITSTSSVPVKGSENDQLGSQLLLGVLDGYHKEQGTLRVYDPPPQLCGGATALVVPTTSHPPSSFHVIHPSAISARRAQLSKFMADIATPPSTDYSEAVKGSKHLAEQHAGMREQNKAAEEEMPVEREDVLRHMLQIGGHQTERTMENVMRLKGPFYDVFFSNGEYSVSDTSLIPPSVFSSSSWGGSLLRGRDSVGV